MSTDPQLESYLATLDEPFEQRVAALEMRVHAAMIAGRAQHLSAFRPGGIAVEAVLAYIDLVSLAPVPARSVNAVVRGMVASEPLLTEMQIGDRVERLADSWVQREVLCAVVDRALGRTVLLELLRAVWSSAALRYALDDARNQNLI